MRSVQNNSFTGQGNDFVVGPSSSNIEKRYATTEAQLEVWLSSLQSTEANCSYNEISSIVIKGDLDVDIIKKAIQLVGKRNASLRSTFSEDGQQVLVHSDVEFEFEIIDWATETGIDLDQAIQEVVRKQACTPFDLVTGPLLRFVLQKVSNQHFRLTFTAHHAILDGWSFAVFCRDLGHFYDSIATNSECQLPPACQYDQYAQSMLDYFDSEQGKADEAFWVSQFKDSIPVLDLPIENKRPALRTYSGRRCNHVISSELVSALRNAGSKTGCSLFNTVLAAFQAYVSRLSGNEDIVLGIPTAGQVAMDQLDLIGHCVNTIPLRTKVSTESTFTEFMKQSRGELLNAMDHQRYSFGTLLRKLAPPRDPSRPPMLSVSFNIDPVIDTSEMGFTGLDLSVMVEPRAFENFEWFINGVINQDQSIELQIQYNAELYSEQSMSFYFQGFQAFLEGIVENSNQKISEVPMMTVDQRQQLIVDWNGTELDYPTTATLHSEFSRQATATPDNVAVQFGERTLTYKEVENQSNRIARYLQSKGIKPGDLVGICTERSENMLVNLFGILKTGAGYVPLDPAYPSDRLQYMCDHSKLKLIVTQDSLVQRASEFGKSLIAIDSAWNEIETLDESHVNAEVKPENTCYVIYTSGSTGKPKGVNVPHGAVVNFLYSMMETPGFDANDSVMAVTTLSFDIAVLELYLPTISGARVVIASSEVASDGIQLAQSLEEHNITLLQATPATWRMLIQSGWEGSDRLKVLCGGEPMPQDLVGPLLDRCKELWNMYGPTETTVWSAAFQITSENATILIGKPIGNTQIYILDQNGQEVPVGCVGEVFIGGAGVTLGYLHRDDLTQERFVENRYFDPFTQVINHRLYKTGDLARYRFDGNIQFLRRNDKQVKVRGFRIELGEIEQNLKTHPSIEQVVVIVREDTVGDARLVGYVIGKPNTEIIANELRNHLRDSVPHYMVPQHFVQLTKMPQTDNGKIDYKALPAPTVKTENQPSQSRVPETDSEKLLATIWRNVLEVEEVELDDNFFDLGGHSLLVMNVIKAVQEKAGFRLGPQDFLVGTLEQLAEKFQVNSNNGADQSNPKSDNSDLANMERPVQESESTKAPANNGLINKVKGFWD